MIKTICADVRESAIGLQKVSENPREKNESPIPHFQELNSNVSLSETLDISEPLKGRFLKKQKLKAKIAESDETKDLTTQELQCLVYLEQLQVFRLAKELLLL